MDNFVLLILCTMLFRFNGSPNITMKGVICSLINTSFGLFYLESGYKNIECWGIWEAARVSMRYHIFIQNIKSEIIQVFYLINLEFPYFLVDVELKHSNLNSIIFITSVSYPYLHP